MSESNVVYQQSKQQVLLLAAVMFTSIVAAIVASTYITMSLMKGEVAGAVAATQAQSSSMNTCVDMQAVADQAAAGAVAASDNKKHHDVEAKHMNAGYGSAWGMMPHGDVVTSNSGNVVTTTNNTNTYNTTDNSQWQLIDNTDNSKGKTTVNNNTTNNNTVNQNGHINMNHQDLSNKTSQTVAPVNMIDNEYNKNSKNTDNSQTILTKDSNNTDNSDNSVNVHDNKGKLELPVLY